MKFKILMWIFSCFRIKQLFRTADLMYSMPLHRATIYIFGIFVGYAMRMYKHVKLSKVRVIQIKSIENFNSYLYLPEPFNLRVVNKHFDVVNRINWTSQNGKHELQIQSIWCCRLCGVQSNVMVHHFRMDHLHHTHRTLM